MSVAARSEVCVCTCLCVSIRETKLDFPPDCVYARVGRFLWVRLLPLRSFLHDLRTWICVLTCVYVCVYVYLSGRYEFTQHSRAR